MASFDLDTFLTLQGQGQGVVGSLGTSFGFPSCLLNFTEDLFSLLPSGVLISLNDAADSGRSRANSLTASIFSTLTFESGIVSFDTETGMISFGSNSSKIDAENSGELNDLNFFVSAVGEVLGGAGQLYRNYQIASAQYEQLERCIRGFVNQKKATGGSAANERAKLGEEEYRRRTEAAYNKYLNQLRSAKEASDRLARTQASIQNVLDARAENPDLEPEFNPAYVNLVSGTSFRLPSDEEDQEADEIIRLVYGPPQTSNGRYLLSTDGLYYDSQTEEGLEPVLLFVSDNKATIEEAKKWRFNYAPNIGGKGDQVNSNTFNKWLASPSVKDSPSLSWTKTIFDDTIINEDATLRVHYEKDHFLRVLEGQKEKRILDIDKQIEELEESGASQSVIDNFKQSLLSEVAYHNKKINRRKKQIEIAVFAPSIFNRGTSPEPGKVPINDFSYLQDCNISLALDTQRKLILDQEEVSGVVLPLRPTFTVSKSVEASESIEHLFVPEVGLGAIITDNRDPTESSSLELSISDVIISDKLIGVYNFLNSKTTTPSSTDFDVLNCSTDDNYNNAQLVAPNAEFVFGKSADATLAIGYGLGAAYLEGITRNYDTNPSGLGSYVKLPDTEEYQDWLYNRSGATFDTWVYAPYLTFDESWDEGLATSSLYRLILACENTGSLPGATRSSSEDILNVEYTDGSDYTKGLIFGFTRDIRWRGQVGPSNDGSIQAGADGGLILAPTVAYDGSSVAFVAKAKAQNSCIDTSGWVGMYVPLTQQTSSGKTLESCSNGFCQLSVTLDYEDNEVNLYLDSELLATSAISEVFGSPPTHSIKLPTFKKANSFEYSESTVGPLAPRSLKSGPKLNTYFTPWILGGGYTDGMAETGNFMGGEYGGVRSGLRGYLGSTKFYSKPLTQKELAFNNSIQSKLYKNLDGVNTEFNVIIALGQSNIDGYYVPLSSPGVPEMFKQAQRRTKIWMPDSLVVSSGSWRDLDPTGDSDPNFGGYNADRTEFLYDPTPPNDPTPPDLFLAGRFVANYPRHYDPLMEFAYKLSEDLDDDVYLIKNTKGGTAMVSGLEPVVSYLSWTDRNQLLANIQGYDLYSTLKHDVSAAIAALQAPFTRINVKAILMMQGEFESGPAESQTNYPNPEDFSEAWAHYFSGTLYPELQADIKAALGTPGADDIPWIFTRVHEELGENPQFPYTSNVRAQQEAVDASPDLEAHIVPVDGLSFTDGTKIHFDASSLTTIGDKLYAKYKEIYP